MSLTWQLVPFWMKFNEHASANKHDFYKSSARVAAALRPADLQTIKHLVGDYFAKRMTMMAGVTWQENNWTQQDMEDILNEPDQ